MKWKAALVAALAGAVRVSSAARLHSIPSRARLRSPGPRATVIEPDPAHERALLGPAAIAVDEALISGVKHMIDVLYRGRDIERFYVLETVARVPYFAFLSCLHLYETLGRRDMVSFMHVHYEQADNELHHLLIMEALGGADAYLDRFVAQHLAVFYFWFVAALYALRPQQAYHLSELIEAHAFATYDAFLGAHAERLRAQPVPEVARAYYEGARSAPSAPARLDSLYDVFVRVRDDEQGHRHALQCLAAKELGEMDECALPDGGGGF